MAVKVEASLWTMTADHRAPVRETKARDFERKLGLSDHASTPNDSTGWQRDVQASPQQHPHSVVPDADLTRILRPRPADASDPRSAGALELYALGARAGHHLSYRPDAFLAGPDIRSVATVDAMQGYSVPLSAVPFPSTTSLMSIAVATAGPVALWDVAVGSQQQGLEGTSQVQFLSYLTRKWPDRHFQFLPRDKGIELVVRDYRLTSLEHDELVEELSRRAASMSERPQQIWLNGREVWRAASLSNEGEHHGR
ncbi:hypothetical protein V3H56_11225 [Pseudomonas sp. MS646]|uniref:hypothetical protein n=1 Tax=Pseudomonas sp. MS646 TaxID=3118751 RepID=UPI0030CCC30D